MKKAFLIVVVFVLSLNLLGQNSKSRAELEKEIATLQSEIATANKLLKETSKNKKLSLNQVSILDKKIKQRQQLVKAYNGKIAVLDGNIRESQKKINVLNNDLDKYRKEYSKMIMFAYRNRNHYDVLEFVFASEDFNQAFSRLRYIRQFSDARKSKMDQIAEAERQLNEEIEKNKKSREEQAALLKDEKEQQTILKSEKTELDAQVSSLKRQEGSIQQSIKQKQQQSQKLQRMVAAIIEEEIRKAAEKNKNKDAKTGSGNMALSHAEQKLSANFTGNKGILPWPTEKGVISSTFGKHSHPVSDQIQVTNNGIDIAAPRQAKARSVFEGEVVSVNKITANNIAIIIRHGDYFTVYSNLASVYVKRGDKVKTRQEIGLIYTDIEEDKTELHFELWHGRERLNPSAWLVQ